MRAKFEARFPQAVWLEYEPVSRDRALLGSRLAFGRPVRTHLALEDAALESFEATMLAIEANDVNRVYARNDPDFGDLSGSAAFRALTAPLDEEAEEEA